MDNGVQEAVPDTLEGLRSRLIVGDQIGPRPTPQWLEAGYLEFLSRLTQADYPCYLGVRAVSAGHLYYTFANDPVCKTLPKSVSRFIEQKKQVGYFDTNLAILLAPDQHRRLTNRPIVLGSISVQAVKSKIVSNRLPVVGAVRCGRR